MPKRPAGSAQDRKPNHKQKPVDALELLKQDHENVQELFAKFGAAGAGEHQAIAQRIFKDLDLHDTLEKEYFYPALQDQEDFDELISLQEGDDDVNGVTILDHAGSDNADDDDILLEDDAEDNGGNDIITAAFEDHDSVKELIHRLKSLNPQSNDFREGLMELEAIVTDHMAQEEDSLFLEAKCQLDIRTLGEQMRQRKHDLLTMPAYKDL